MRRFKRQCQVNGELSVQACGEMADAIYRCEIIDAVGKHKRHQVGVHTIQHSLFGNGYSCDAVDEAIQAGKSR